MTFGNGAGDTSTNTLYFAAGINQEQGGLFASISLASNPPSGSGPGSARQPGLEEVFGIVTHRDANLTVSLAVSPQEGNSATPLSQEGAANLVASKSLLKRLVGERFGTPRPQREQVDLWFGGPTADDTMPA
jgi:hypothetical protein